MRLFPKQGLAYLGCKMQTIKTHLQDSIFTISLARPDVRNAFNDQLIDELQSTFEDLAKKESIRIVLLKGEGPLFCAGGDLNWMQKSIQLNEAENLKETQKLSFLFETLNACPKPVIGSIHGAAIGGGVGLVSICDYVLCSQETVFSLSEVRLGIVPACIGPFVISKVGESHARALFLSGERFNADRALRIGLAHEVLPDQAQLEQRAFALAQQMLQCGPHAMAAAKTLIHELKEKNFRESQDYVAQMLAQLRVSEEGQEGLKAFLERRKPDWMKSQ